MPQAIRTQLSNISVHSNDLPEQALALAQNAGMVAWDIETSGLDWSSDAIGTCQIFIPGDIVYVIKTRGTGQALMTRLLQEEGIAKIFHHALFDLRFLKYQWGVEPNNIFCTKIASKILNPKDDDHSLKKLLNKYLDIDIDKGQRRSNWLSDSLSEDQIIYAANDVLYLPELIKILFKKCEEEDLESELLSSFMYIPTRVELDIRGSGDVFTY